MSPESTRGNPIAIQDVAVLAKEFFVDKSLEIVSFTLTPFSKDTLGILATHKLLNIKAQEKGNPKSLRTLTFFVKLKSNGNLEFFNEVFLAESKFFREVAPRLKQYCTSDPWSPKCYLARDDVIILEDLRLQGFETCNELLSESQMKSAVATLARFHAASIILENTRGKPLSDLLPEFSLRKNFTSTTQEAVRWLETGCEAIEAVADKLNINHNKCIWPAYEIAMDSVKWKKGQLIVLGHNDLWLNNLMFKGGEKTECRLVDFQTVSHVFYIIDLIQLIFLNNTKESRDRLEREFIEVYFSELTKNLKTSGFEKEIVSLDDIFSDYEKNKITGLVFSVHYLPITLLSKEFTEKYVENLEYHSTVNRKDFVLDVLERDNRYKCRIEENVKELIELMADQDIVIQSEG